MAVNRWQFQKLILSLLVSMHDVTMMPHAGQILTQCSFSESTLNFSRKRRQLPNRSDRQRSFVDKQQNGGASHGVDANAGTWEGGSCAITTMSPWQLFRTSHQQISRLIYLMRCRCVDKTMFIVY